MSTTTAQRLVDNPNAAARFVIDDLCIAVIRHWFCSTLFLLCFLLTSCQTLPMTPHLAKSQSLTQQTQLISEQLNQDNHLIKRISKTNNPQPQSLSGYYPLIASTDAFAARSVLSQLSQHSIDVQYYIWHNDESGQLLLKDLYNAANRGVKVRLLLDDFNTDPQFDQVLLSFAGHPNIAVRVINPKRIRAFSTINFVTAFPHYQRRMHNKSMIFDHQLAIIGGRNIGDEYLRGDKDDAFADLDVLLAGKVAADVDDNFERYWQSGLAYDIERLVRSNNKSTTDTVASPQPFLQTLTKIAPANPNSKLNSSVQLYQSSRRAGLDKYLLNHNVNFRWSVINFVSDDVRKLRQTDEKYERVVHQLQDIIGTPKQRFTIISSYFVPTKRGIAELSKLAHDGVKVTLLTNSFNSTDVPIVHSGYSETRKALLKAGIALYELKADADPDLRRKKRSLGRNKISTSLHTKAFAVDDCVTFIGSYNVDPRSANFNTEHGVLIYDPLLANNMHRFFDASMLNVSYQLVLDKQGNIVWRTHSDTSTKKVINLTHEPNISKINALWVSLFSFLPIEWLL